MFFPGQLSKAGGVGGHVFVATHVIGEKKELRQKAETSHRNQSHACTHHSEAKRGEAGTNMALFHLLKKEIKVVCVCVYAAMAL